MVIFFEYHNCRFFLDAHKGIFVTARDFDLKLGLGSDRALRLILYGQNSLDVRSKSIILLLIEQLLHPFTFFQILSVLIWSCEEYQLYALCILSMTSLSVMTTVLDLRRNGMKMNPLIKKSSTVTILCGKICTKYQH